MNNRFKAHKIKAPASFAAVSLCYDKAAGGAPVVSACGREDQAKLMQRVARRYGVPVVKQEALAESLAQVEVNTEIPAELYLDVAKVLLKEVGPKG